MHGQLQTHTTGALPGPSQQVTTNHNGSQSAHGAPAPACSAIHSAPQMPTRPQPQRPPPVTTDHDFSRGPSPGAFRPSQRVTTCQLGPSPSALRPSKRVTTAHKGRNPSVHHPSQRVTNAHEAPAPANFARHNGSQSAHGPQPQRAPPFTGRHKCPQGLSPHRPPPVTTGHKCSRRQPQAHSIRRPLVGLQACEIVPPHNPPRGPQTENLRSLEPCFVI